MTASFGELTEISRNGRRLVPDEWPRPEVGEFRISICDRNNRRRTLRDLKLWRYSGTTMVPRLGMADPALIDILGDGYAHAVRSQPLP
jgi:hypothetical protein